MAKQLNKTHIIELTMDQVPIDKKLAIEFINTFFRTMASELQNGNSVTVAGFGKFAPKTIPGRKRYIPYTGDYTISPNSQGIKFEVGVKLKKQLNKNE